MNTTKLYRLFLVCLLALSMAACDGGVSGPMSDGWVVTDQGQGGADGTSESSAAAAEPVIDEPPPIINPTWQEVPDSKLSSVLYDWSPNNVPGYYAGLFAWSGGTFDPVHNRLLLLGGGHGDYGGQEIYAFNLDTKSWEIVALPDTWEAIMEDRQTCQYENRTVNNFPKSVHTYGRLFYNATLNALCDPRGSIGYQNCTAGADMACYDFDTNEWLWDFGTSLTTDIVGGAGSAGAVDPSTNIYWIHGAGGNSNARLARYDMETNTWLKGKYDNILAVTWNKISIIDSNSVFIMVDENFFYAMPLSEFSLTSEVSKYQLTLTGVGPSTDLRWSYKLAIAHDPVSDNVVVVDNSLNVYLLNIDVAAGTGAWTQVSTKGPLPQPLEKTGTFGRFSYSPADDVFVMVNSINTNVFFLDLRSSVTTFDITSATTNAAHPFTTAVAFKKGDILEIPKLDLDNYQVEIKKRWNDSSVKHAIFSGAYPSTANVPTTVTVSDGGTVPTGIDLSEADIVAAAPTASVVIGAIGTVNVADLLGTPDQVWLQGPEMIEAHYSSDVSADLVVKFHVRLYAGGEMRVRAIVENGTINGANATESYVPTVTIGGTVVFDNGGVALDHYAHTRWDALGWINIPDPDTTVAHDTTYLQESKTVPNYWKSGPNESALNGFPQDYLPMGRALWRENMANAGYHPQIGILPLWDALYLTSGGDSRAYAAVEIQSRALNSYPLIWSDPATNSPIVLDSWPNWTVYGTSGNGATSYVAGDLRWDVAHHGSGGYFAYLITGDYFHLETMQHQAALTYLVTRTAKGLGVNRLIEPVETRGVAWSNRTISELVSIAPLDPVVSDFQTQLSNSMDHWNNVVNAPRINELGYFHKYASGGWTDGLISIFEQNFLTMSFGYISDLEPLADMTNLNTVKNHIYKGIVGLLGGGGVDNYCYYRAADPFNYITDANNVNIDPTTWYDSWGAVYAQNWGEPNPEICPTILSSEGSMSSNPDSSTGYWANLLPAIAYAVEDGAPGAADSWARLTGADNWSEFENAGFENTPIWGIWPREIK